MNLRDSLFLAAIAIVTNACATSKPAEPAPAEAPTAARETPDVVVDSVPNAGALPDFSSASNDAPDAEAPAIDETIGTTENLPPPNVPPKVDADDVREAVFRHMFGSNASGQQNGSGVFCLIVEGDRDPTPGFLARFKNVKTTTRAASGCTASARGVIDKKTNKHGLIFRIDSMEFKDAKHATVHGGYFEAGLSASGNVYTLEHKTGGWVVTKDEMMWIS